MPTVEFLVNELGGEIEVTSGGTAKAETGARFRVKIPMEELERGQDV